jgi:histidine ammonia-lyase
VRTVDLAVYADALAGEAAALTARIERARAQLRQAELEREAREDLPERTVERLAALGLLRPLDDAPLRCAVEAWTAALEALEELQAWIEERLARAQRHEEPAVVVVGREDVGLDRADVTRARP